MEYVLSLNAVDAALGCVRLRWGTAECGENEAEMDRLEGETSRNAAEKRSGVIPFERNLRTAHATRANTAVQPFTTEMP